MYKNNPAIRLFPILIYILIICICGITNSVYAQHESDEQAYQFISPVPGSKYNNVNAGIILRTGELIDDIYCNTFEVYGSISNVIDGNIVLSSDHKTLTFTPSVAYVLGETIHVKINQELSSGLHMLPPLYFTFHVSNTDQSTIRLHEQNTDNYEAMIHSSREHFSLKAGYAFANNDSLPEEFSEIETQIYNDPMPGYNFIAPMKHLYHYLVICDNHSTPVFYRKVPWGATDFKVQPSGLLTYFSNKYRCFYGLDKHFNVVDTFSCQNGYAGSTDMHELRLQNNGHYFILAYDPQLVGMDTVVPGGDPDAVVTGLVVQELDENDQVVFQWRSWDHFKITDADEDVDLLADLIDYVHGNSIEIGSDTSILISCRNMNEITKIDRRTGELIWRLNGENNQFTFINDEIRFSRQHSIRYMPDSSHISMFDNGCAHEPVPFSSGLEYEIDEEAMTATLIERLHATPKIYSSHKAHTQRHPNGWTTMGWGYVNTNITTGYDYVPGITEYKADRSVALEISFPNDSYRAFKFDWVTTALVPDQKEVIFESVSINDSASAEIYIKNNTSLPMVINRVLHREEQFRCDNSTPLTINSMDSALLTITYKPEQDTMSEDVFTFCCDTYDELPQRIACQVNTIGIPEHSGTDEESHNYPSPVSIYPNPAGKRIYIQTMTSNEPQTLHVYSMSRNKVAEIPVQAEQVLTEVDVSTYPDGIYLICLSGELVKKHCKKFVVKH